MNYKKAYEDLVEEFGDYKLHSICWGSNDFTSLEKDGWQITKEQAEEACLDMIHNHDCEHGITWDSVDYYYEQYGKEVEEGKEAWRKLLEELENQE
jgi:hypothetical protein